VSEVIYASRASEVANERFDALACAALGINRTDATCLNIVDNEGGAITAGRLAELAGLTTAAVTAVVDRLEAKGYLRRARDENDRRRVIVEVTEQMNERGEIIWGPLGEEARRLFGRRTADELRVIREFFESARDLNERHAERIRDLRFD
jgi:DNA-binding MarR family transcriptional regulator